MTEYVLPKNHSCHIHGAHFDITSYSVHVFSNNTIYYSAVC